MESKQTLGLSPAVLAHRDIVKPHPWCPIPDIEFDPCCDPDNPKTVLHKHVMRAAAAIKEEIPKTPMMKSRRITKFDFDLYYKFEIFHHTGSFCERGALYSLMKLKKAQREVGVYTASLGNWAMALSYYGQKLDISVTVVLPVCTKITIVEKCQEFGATVNLFGNDLGEAKYHAFTMIADTGGTYINSYDHPDVIAGAGTIGVEILEQLSQTDVILVPIGGGGLIAGIATVVKHFKPNILIYGIEPKKSCCFFKAMDNERPYKTTVIPTIAESLAVPTAGYNAYHTAQSLIDKMVLVEDDWIAQAIMHLVDDVKYTAEGAGVASISALLPAPDLLPELKGKNVVCVITGGNIDQVTLINSLERAKAVEGQLIKLTVTLPADSLKEQLKVLSMISNVGCNIREYHVDRGWLTDNDVFTIYLTLIIETFGLEQACRLKRIMERLFPDICDFLEEPYSPLPVCACFPRRW